uniref:Alpha-1,6-mannosyl-glycoprotein 2-beta-N-acetylglucosaminyltransferase n=1 Tax=Schistosoma japonicum TaxID=6182 RepID=C1LG38_SCHJA|nr:alpha-1,6-mannosyl-glycoprotein [Schistosoma japonicum]
MRIKIRSLSTPIFLLNLSFICFRILTLSLSLLLILLVVNLLFTNFWWFPESSTHERSNVLWLWKDTVLSYVTSSWLQSVRLQHPKNVAFDLKTAPPNSGPFSKLLPLSLISNLRQYISNINRLQFVQNEDLYGQLPTRDNFTFITSPEHVIIVQVHNRSLELSLLIESLRRTSGIEKALVIFSHDVYSDELNNLIGSIRFTRTAQIFYPHSIQIFPNSFPGTDPRDCHSRINPAKASDTGCLNSDWPDTYQHYRESNFTQIKHHWLWKIEFVINHFYPTKYYKGYFILLEEDHFVVEDIFHVSTLISNKIWSPLNANGIVALGSYDKDNKYVSSVAEVTYWLAPKHNMGMAVSRAVWRKIEDCLEQFCDYDDYNWDWSLQYVGQKCFPNKLKALTLPLSTRVFHLGECRGLHHQKNVCSAELLATNIIQMFSGVVLTKLYPKDLHLSYKLPTVGPKQTVNGGWSDPRDRNLCRSFLSNKWNDVLIQMAPTLIKYSPIY